jgi:hypothetical protein
VCGRKKFCYNYNVSLSEYAKIIALVEVLLKLPKTGTMARMISLYTGEMKLKNCLLNCYCGWIIGIWLMEAVRVEKVT